MAGAHISIPDLDPDLNNVLQLAGQSDRDLQHFLLTVQSFRNLTVLIQGLTSLEQKMSDQINALTAEVANTAAVMTAAGSVIEAALSAEATLKDQLTKATDPADQKALSDATAKLAEARAGLQSEIDKANAANPPAAAAAPAAPAAPPTGAAS